MQEPDKYSPVPVRLKENMSVAEAVGAIAEENPGAVLVCGKLLEMTEKIDPDWMWGKLRALFFLDALNIYGKRIYSFWHDVCGEDLAKMIAVMRAQQLGQLAGVNRTSIHYAIDNHGEGLENLDAVVLAVKERLPNFNSSPR